MILRRLIEHVKAQHWTAVVLDFVIVVAGVFIGIQLGNWNEARAERAQLDQQLVSLRIELEGDLVAIAAYRAATQRQVDDVAAVRAALGADPAGVDLDQLDAQLMNIFGVAALGLQQNAYQELADTGGIRRLSGTPLRAALSEWESALARLQRLNEDALTFRAQSVPYLLSGVSIGAMIEHHGSSQAEDVARSRFRNDPALLADDRALDSYLALRFAIEAEIVTYSDKLAEDTQAVIDLLAEREEG